MLQGTWWRGLLRHCAGSIPESDTGYCHSLNASCTTNGNEYREYFLGYQGIHGPIVLKSGSLNLLQPARPVQGLIDLYLYISGLKKSNKVQTVRKYLFNAKLLYMFPASIATIISST